MLPEEFAEAGDPLLMALFEGDGDGARQLSGTYDLLPKSFWMSICFNLQAICKQIGSERNE